jgi:iron complex outermembrane receptor protein
VFGGRNGKPVLTADGFQVAQRDRLSIALLNQVAGQYIGRFMDDRLRVEVGVRAPFFKRELNQFCYTEARGGGFAYCTSEPVASLRIIGPNDAVPATGATPYFAPFETDYKFDALLPNVGATFKITPALSVFGSYAKGFSSPRTDNLYRAPRVTLDPETTDTFDLGLRYTSGRVQAQGTAWMINYKNRILSSFNQDLGISLDRNVGKVESYGFDGSIAYQPMEPLTLYLFGSYIKAEFQEDVEIGRTLAPTGGATVPVNTLIFAPTKGKMVAETPEWQLGGRAQFEVGPFELGVQGKWVDDRFATDVNDVLVQDYFLVDLDARLSLDSVGLRRTYLQLNVSNLFNKFYFGNLSTQINAGNICPTGATCSANGANPNFSVGAPRTVQATLNFQF